MPDHQSFETDRMPRVTGSAGGAHCAWLDRDAPAAPLAALGPPLIRREHFIQRGKNARADFADQSPSPILARRMLSANSAMDHGHLNASAPSRLYGQARHHA